MSVSDLPKTLYKYSHFDSNAHFLDLLAGRLFFSSARDFNDPFDCTLVLNADGAPPERRREWVLDALGRFEPQWSEEKRLKVAEEWVWKSINDPAFLQEREEISVRQQLEKFGVCCLAAIADNILMWSHYSQKHTGLCVGVDTDLLIDRAKAGLNLQGLVTPYAVTYSDEMPQADFYDMMLDNYDVVSRLMSTVTTKSSHWEYEREVRLFYWDHIGETFDFGFEVVKEVFLGCRTSEADIRRVLDELDRLESRAVVFKGELHRSRFELPFLRIR